MTDTGRIVLRRLDVDLGAAYLEMVDEFVAAGEDYPYNNIPLAREDMACAGYFVHPPWRVRYEDQEIRATACQSRQTMVSLSILGSLHRHDSLAA